MAYFCLHRDLPSGPLPEWTAADRYEACLHFGLTPSFLIFLRRYIFGYARILTQSYKGTAVIPPSHETAVLTAYIA